jgi:hypothetical protein
MWRLKFVVKLICGRNLLMFYILAVIISLLAPTTGAALLIPGASALESEQVHRLIFSLNRLVRLVCEGALKFSDASVRTNCADSVSICGPELRSLPRI